MVGYYGGFYVARRVQFRRGGPIWDAMDSFERDLRRYEDDNWEADLEKRDTIEKCFASLFSGVLSAVAGWYCKNSEVGKEVFKELLREAIWFSVGGSAGMSVFPNEKPA